MHYIVALYQEIAESEIENQPRVSRINSMESPVRNTTDLLRNTTDRNNPMQSSIIKLLNELESNDATNDTSPLVKETTE
jgi:hypothetical protein